MIGAVAALLGVGGLVWVLSSKSAEPEPTVPSTATLTTAPTAEKRASASNAGVTEPSVNTIGADALAPRDSKADYEALVLRTQALILDPAERAVAASAALRAAKGDYPQALTDFGPLVARRVREGARQEMKILEGIDLADYSSGTVARLRTALAEAEKASQAGAWAEEVARRDEALSLVPSARTEISAQLTTVARAAAGRNDQDLATYFYERALRLDSSLTEATDHLYAFKFKPGQTLRTALGLELAYVPPGTFVRGSRAGEPGRDADEVQATVRLSKGFFIGLNEVTQRQWDAVFGAGDAARVISSAPARSSAIGPDLPMHSVTWYEAVAFCEKLSAVDGRRFRLPTEAEWEYAARAGTTSAFSNGTDSLSQQEGNTDDGSATAAFAPVAAGSKNWRNLWGLRDVHGNVWEWCADWSAAYPAGDVIDPRGPADEAVGRADLALRVARGGGFNAAASDARSANRWEYSPVAATGYIGLRVVQEPELVSP